MEKLQGLLDEVRNAKGWCDHNGDHDTGMVSMSVETLECWENAIIDIIEAIEDEIADIRAEGYR